MDFLSEVVPEAKPPTRAIFQMTVCAPVTAANNKPIIFRNPGCLMPVAYAFTFQHSWTLKFHLATRSADRPISKRPSKPTGRFPEFDRLLEGMKTAGH